MNERQERGRFTVLVAVPELVIVFALTHTRYTTLRRIFDIQYTTHKSKQSRTIIEGEARTASQVKCTD